MLGNLLVSTLMSASVYAMLAVGFSLTFGVARIINLAHTAFYMVASYIIFTATMKMGLPLYVGVVAAVSLVVLLAMVTYKVLVDPMREHETTVLILTIGVALVLQELMFLWFGGYFRSVPTAVEGFTTLLGVRVSYQYVLTICVLIVTLALVWLLLMKTRLGLAIRATAQDREIANVMGMSDSRTATITVGIAAALAAIAGAIVAPLFIIEPRIWLSPLTVVLAISVLGGLGSLKGSILGAVIIALSENLVVFLVPQGAFFKGAFSLLIMIVVLLIRPEGLYGVAFEEER
ncbi:MAG: branched-chain amino acid ABC transporter permease [Bacillota bacterium]|nr:MAG: branched-chain amino acid ABC transporter permease [Bacillota bacterium]